MFPDRLNHMASIAKHAGREKAGAFLSGPAPPVLAAGHRWEHMNVPYPFPQDAAHEADCQNRALAVTPALHTCPW